MRQQRKGDGGEGRCRRSTTGVVRTLTGMQATNAPVEHFLRRWRSAPAPGMREHADPIGNASRRHGIEKKVPKEATAHPAAITSMPMARAEMIRLSRGWRRPP